MDDLSTNTIVKELYSSANEKVIEINGESTTSHTALLRLTCRNKEEFIEWFHNHQSLTGVTFRVKNVRPIKGITIVYKAEFRCQRNTYPDSHKDRNVKPTKQHTGCEATAKVTIKSSVEGRRVRSQDYLRKDYPTIVEINHNHNHEINLEDYKGPRRRNRHRPETSLTSTYNSAVISFVNADELALIESENPTIYELPVTGQHLLEEPQEEILFVENTRDNICFMSQEDEECYNWEEAEAVMADATSTLTDLLKSSFPSRPCQVMDAVKRFQDGVNSLKTESELLAALFNFGRQRPASSSDVNMTEALESTTDDYKRVETPVENPLYCYTSPDGTTYEIVW